MNNLKSLVIITVLLIGAVIIGHLFWDVSGEKTTINNSGDMVRKSPATSDSQKRYCDQRALEEVERLLKTGDVWYLCLWRNPDGWRLSVELIVHTTPRPDRAVPVDSLMRIYRKHIKDWRTESIALNNGGGKDLWFSIEKDTGL